MTQAENTVSTRRRGTRGWMTLGAALLVGLIVWVLAVPLLGIPLVAGGQSIGPLSIAVATLVGGTCAWALRVALRRFRSGRTIWTAIGCAFLAVSLLAPALSGATGSALITLEAMHLCAGGILIVGLRGPQTGGAEDRVKSGD